MDVRSLSRWRALNERTAFPAASLHRSPLVGRATVTSTTSLMLRTIALAGVHDGKSISFRVSLSGSWHETKFRATRRRRHREREGERNDSKGSRRRNSLSWRTNYSWAGGETVLLFDPRTHGARRMRGERKDEEEGRGGGRGAFSAESRSISRPR